MMTLNWYDENLNYSKLGLTEDVDTVINSGHGVSQFIARVEPSGGTSSSSSSSSSTIYPSRLKGNSGKYEKILLNGAQGYVAHSIKIEDLKKFDAIDEYFKRLIGKPPRITVNQEIGRNIVTKGITVSNTRLPQLTDDDHPGYGRDIADDSGLIIGACMGKVLRRSADWLIKLRDVVINVKGENLLFKALTIKIDPSNIVPTSSNSMNDYTLCGLRWRQWQLW